MYTLNDSGDTHSNVEITTEIRFQDECVTDADIEKVLQFKGLRKLVITGCTLTGDLSNLNMLPELTNLCLSGNNISDISMLSELTSLQEITLALNGVRDVSPLVGLSSLKKLDLSRNHWLANISPLGSITSLEELNLYDNDIKDVTPLSKLVNLRWLSLEQNPVKDLQPLKDLPNLSYLCLTDWRLAATTRDQVINMLDNAIAAKNNSIYGVEQLEQDASTLIQVMSIHPDYKDWFTHTFPNGARSADEVLSAL